METERRNPVLDRRWKRAWRGAMLASVLLHAGLFLLLGTDVAVYLDGGQAPVGVASTIVDLTGAAPRVLREGAVSLDKIRKVIDIP